MLEHIHMSIARAREGAVITYIVQAQYMGLLRSRVSTERSRAASPDIHARRGAVNRLLKFSKFTQENLKDLRLKMRMKIIRTIQLHVCEMPTYDL